MANAEHVNIQQQGVKAWNDWRHEHPDEPGDLSGAKLMGLKLMESNLSSTNLVEALLSFANLDNADLSRAILQRSKLNYAVLNFANLSEADLIGADLTGANLNGVNFGGANLSNAILGGAKLGGANLIGAILDGTNLSGANLSGVNLSGANLNGANISSANLSGANLSGTNLSGANLANVNLSGANLFRANLNGANLNGANLVNANLIGTTIEGANLGGANLSRADLGGASLNHANLLAANLTGANLSGVNLNRAVLTRADLTGVKLPLGGAVFTNLDLSETIGLETILQGGPSTIGIDTIYKSRGQTPERFLRDAGVPEPVIQLTRALRKGPVATWESYFIRHSIRDEEFARQLQANLRISGLRAWLVPDNPRDEQPSLELVLEIMQPNDRLLPVLSVNSLQTEWVATEIRRTLELEKKEKRRKLFPVRLAEAGPWHTWTCFDDDTGRDLAAAVRERSHPDFANWKNPVAFQAEFSRLLKAFQEDYTPAAWKTAKA
jgi:uncharacterized protein YjbI with pentapeptide repeats